MGTSQFFQFFELMISPFLKNEPYSFLSRLVKVLDRLCLLAFTGFTVVLSAAVLIAAPHVIVV